MTPFVGQQVALVASPEGAQLRLATAAETAAASAAATGPAAAANGSGNGSSAKPLAITKAKAPGIIQLLDCVSSVGGAKAAACAQLEQVSNGYSPLILWVSKT